MSINPDTLLRIALEEAEESATGGGLPFACVVSDQEGNVVYKDHDRVEELVDPTAHAEVNAIRAVCKKLNTRDLSNYVFYCTSEPCPTCLSALIKARVQKVYYGAETEDTASLPIKAVELAARSSRPIEVVGGILARECLMQRKKYVSES